METEKEDFIIIMSIRRWLLPSSATIIASMTIYDRFLRRNPYNIYFKVAGIDHYGIGVCMGSASVSTIEAWEKGYENRYSKEIVIYKVQKIN